MIPPLLGLFMLAFGAGLVAAFRTGFTEDPWYVGLGAALILTVFLLGFSEPSTAWRKRPVDHCVTKTRDSTSK